jgi:hypothetical protein
MMPPIEDDKRIVDIATSAWKYTVEGKNQFGRSCSMLSLSQASVNALVSDRALFALIGWLKVANGPNAEFLVANGLCTHLGWPVKQLQHTRRRAIEGGWLVKVRREAKGRAALYRLGASHAHDHRTQRDRSRGAGALLQIGGALLWRIACHFGRPRKRQYVAP